jgi:predicted dehydrogenase
VHLARRASGSRRDFLAATLSGASLAAASRLPAAAAVHAGGSDEIRVALVGCGGRGSGAAADALAAPGARVRIVAMADIFKERIESTRRSLGERFKERVDVPDERCFVGIGGYRDAVDALRPGDVAVFATPPAFRGPHFAHAIAKGVHVFMEKPISIDGPSTRRMLDLAARADAANLKVAVGLMCRHSSARQELFARLHDGEAGELLAFHGFREQGAVMPMDLHPGPPEGMSELLWQAKRFHGFLWASGGVFSDFYVHHIDEVCWMKDAWPVSAEAVGGRHFQGRVNDQNFDSYGVKYTFADGTPFFYSGRTMKDCEHKFGVFGQGTKGAFTISERGHAPARSTIYRGQARSPDAIVWAAAQPEKNPYRQEWEDFLAAIVADVPYNEARRGAEASLVTAMGRFAAHTGRTTTFEQMLASADDLAAGIDTLADDSPPPVVRNAEGKYPVPMPGRYRYEYRD